MPKFIMLIGVPGSGKSTLRNALTDQNGLVPDAQVLSTDDLIEGIAAAKNSSYDAEFKGNIKAATRWVLQRITTLASAADVDVVLDQTNITAKSRASKLAPFMTQDWERHAFVVEAPHREELDRRLNGRAGKTIPRRVVDSMLENLQVPDHNEGFHTVTVVPQSKLRLWTQT